MKKEKVITLYVFHMLLLLAGLAKHGLVHSNCLRPRPHLRHWVTTGLHHPQHAASDCCSGAGSRRLHFLCLHMPGSASLHTPAQDARPGCDAAHQDEPAWAGEVHPCLETIPCVLMLLPLMTQLLLLPPTSVLVSCPVMHVTLGVSSANRLQLCDPLSS